jgi:sterile alpha motif and leucine zipper-containing kinase AZK
LTLYLALNCAAGDPSAAATAAGTSASAVDSGADDKLGRELFRRPLDSFVEIDESQLEFRDRVGVGACGEVFHGKWRGADVAIKCLFTDDGRARRGAEAQPVDQELLQDFRNEVRLMMQLRHPNICLFMGAVIRLESNRLCIVSEFCHRGSLYRILHKSDRELPWLRRISMALDAARGCQFLHTHKPCIVHRDLKSPNLLVDRHWNVKVGDFGLARTKSHFYVSLGGGNVGTPEWTAPEVLKDEEYNEKADVYSFGVVLWEICTRKRPFKGLTQMQVVVAVGFNGERLPRVESADVDPRLSDLMQQCMADTWHERPSFADIVQRLEPVGVAYSRMAKQSMLAQRSGGGGDNGGKASSRAR